MDRLMITISWNEHEATDWCKTLPHARHLHSSKNGGKIFNYNENNNYLESNKSLERLQITAYVILKDKYGTLQSLMTTINVNLSKNEIKFKGT